MSDHILRHLLAHSADRCPEKPALVLGEDRIQYSQLESRSNKTANALIRLGVRPGDLVALQLPHSIDAIVSMFGILKAGATYVPIDPSSPIDRTLKVLEGCKIKTMVSDFNGAETLLKRESDSESLRRILLNEEPPEHFHEITSRVRMYDLRKLCKDERSTPCDPKISVDQPAYILQTSGSTGDPKGVTISHRSSTSFVEIFSNHFDIRPDDRVASLAPLHFDLSIFDVFASISCGATVVMVPKRHSIFPRELAQYISDQRMTVWNSVASTIALLVERGNLAAMHLPKMRIVHFSGEPLRVRHLAAAMAAMPNAQFFNVYGQTEANSTMCYRIDDVPRDANWKIPIGNAIPGCSVFALTDENKKTFRPGEEGELYIDSPTIATGYWNDTSLTKEKFISDPRIDSEKTVYKTGDIVSLNDKMEYVLVGRRDNLVKSRGYRIDLGEIESAIYRLESVEIVAAIPIPDDLLGTVIVTYLTLKDGDTDCESLFSHCSLYLPAYMLPKDIKILSEMPYTETGKIDRKLLKSMALRDNFESHT